MSSFIGTKPHQVPTNGDLGRLAFLDYIGVDDVGTYIPSIASATSITISTQIAFVSGTTTISNINPPSTFANGGLITLIPTGKFSLSTTGNIAISISAEVSKPLYLTYEATTNKWYPSYSNTVNRVTVTAPANGSTLTILDGKTLTVNKTLTLDGIDNKTLTVNKNITLDGADSKTLLLNSSVTLNTTSGNAVTLDLVAGGTVTFTSNKLSVFAATTSSELAGVISDETGFSTTGLLMFNNNPTVVTGIVADAASTTFNLINTNASTVNSFGAATTLNVGYTGTAASTTNISTGALAGTFTKTVNLGTGGAAGSTTNINIGTSAGASNVTIGSTVSGTTTVNYNLDVLQNITAHQNITAYYSSDRRLKEDITPIKNPLDKLLTLSGNTFKWSDKHYATQNQEMVKQYDVGVIAQEVLEVLPEAVHERDSGMLAVDYTKLIPLLIECIKAQQVQIDELLGSK